MSQYLRRAARRWFCTAFGLVAVLLPAAAAAQVNTMELRRNPFSEGMSGFLQANLSLARGNVEYVDVGGSAMLQYQVLHDAPAAAGTEVAKDKAALPWIAHRAFLTVDGRFAENAKGPYISQSFAHARWTGMWHRQAGTELFAQFQYNDFLRLARRALGGIGGRFELVHLKAFMLSLGTAYMLEYERVDDAEGPGASETIVHRWSSYLRLRLAVLDDQLLLQNVTYVQPRFDRPQDVRVLNDLDLVVSVSKALAFVTSLSYWHDSEPPPGIDKDDLRLATSIRVSF